MILFHYETDFFLENEDTYQSWIETVILSEQKIVGEINYIFCDDDYLHDINVKYLNHNTLTDVISFDYSEFDTISGDIFISIDRVRENAQNFNIDFSQELLRVMAHGILHYCGYKDKSQKEVSIMREKENDKIELFHVEQ